MTSRPEGCALSDDQQQVVLDDGSPLLVAAGAGSGKTCLLVAHFLHALLEQGLRPEQLVAVTFTRKAAAELTSRIRAALEQQGRADLAQSLDAANIGTIHSLCRRLLRQRAVEAGVDPAAGILEAEAASLVKDRISREVWEAVVGAADDRQLEVLARGGARLRKQVVALYDRLRGLGCERPQVVIGDGAGNTARPQHESVLDDLGSTLAHVIRDALAAAQACPRMGDSLRKDVARLEAALAWLDQPLCAAERAAQLDLTLDFFPTRKTASMEAAFRPVRDALSRYRAALAVFRLAPMVEVVNRLLEAFHEAYQAHKLDRCVLDFADLELQARKLVLTAYAGGEGDGPARTLLPAGSRVLIDEFQDTNELQCSILEGLGAEKLLMVGDERQSIYRFRGADVGVFRKRESQLLAAGPEGAAGRLYRLDVNYRSQPEILAFINALFGHPAFFGDRFKPLLAAGSERLTPEKQCAAASTAAAESSGVATESADGVAEPSGGAAEPDDSASGFSGAAADLSGALGESTPFSVEVAVVRRGPVSDDGEETETMQQAEAAEVARTIRRLLDDEGWRQQDIAVLLPAQTYVDRYEQALIARGVGVYVVGGKGYYSQEEVADVTSLLRLLVNPHDDLALVTALRSPLVGLSDDALYLLGGERRKTGAQSLWQVVRGSGSRCLTADDARRLELFVERLLTMRRRVGRPGLAQLIDDAVSACDYDLCLLSAPGGKRRFANVRKMMRLAGDYEAVEGPDLAGFVSVLGSMGELTDHEGSAPTLAEGEDVVRIMTVHQAKGLEFPVVVLAGLGSDVHGAEAGDFMVSDDGRIGVFLRGSKHKTYEDADLSWGPAAAILAEERMKECEEDVRLLYVAMTRAKSRLILVGAVPQDGKLEKGRIGRIVRALGLEETPDAGTVFRVPGLDAVVRSPTPSLPDATGVQPPTEAASPPLQAVETSPSLLRLPVDHPLPSRISFSALAAYRQCPRKYYLERVLRLELGEGWNGSIDRSSVSDDLAAGREEVLDESERADGLTVGLLVHALLERVFRTDAATGGERDALSCGERPLEQQLDDIAAAWAEQTGAVLTEAEKQKAFRLALAFWDSPFAGMAAEPETKREVPFLVESDGILFSGVMDLLLPTGAVWQIVDYKTNVLHDRSPEEVASGYRLQAALYCLAALKCGAPSAEIHFVFLERPSEPVTFGYGASDMPELERMLQEAMQGLESGCFDRAVGRLCRTCPVAEACRVMA